MEGEQDDQVEPLNLESEDDKVSEKEKCGLFCGNRSIICAKFQPCATQRSMIIILCIIQTLVFACQNGLVSMSVSTLEKRYQMQSTETGYIVSTFDFIAAPVFIIVAIIGDRLKRKPFWMSVCLGTCSLASFVYMLPYFFSPTYTYQGGGLNSYCNANNGTITSPKCEYHGLRNYRFIFICAVAFFSIGSNPLYIYAMAYIDENVKKSDSGYYTGLFNSFAGVGAALGFVAGGASLNIFVNPHEEVSITPASPLWIGAWWIGFLVCAILLGLMVLPIALLPMYLPGTEKFRVNRSEEAHQGRDSNSHNVVKNMKLLCKNLPFLFVTLGSAINFSLIFGFNTFGAKYLETMFGTSPFYSAIMFGIAAVFAAAGGQLIGGYVVSKKKLKVQGITKFIVLCSGVSCACCLGFLLHCSDESFAGATVPYTGLSTLTLNAKCNTNCSCSTDHYYPVCGSDDKMYFSPCFAGCFPVNQSYYHNCTCIKDTIKTAVSRKCSSSFCSTLPIFLVIVFACFLTSIISDTPTNQITLRCVPFSQRVSAFAMQKVIVHLVGVIPGRILAGKVMDLACAMWTTECGARGSCQAYRRWELARNTTILLFVETLIVMVCYIMVYLTYIPNRNRSSTNCTEVELVLRDR